MVGESGTKFVAYYRVSTQRQEDSGLGIEAQRAQVERYVAGLNGTLVSTFTETESGKRVTRPELEAAIRDAKRQRATLIVAKLDRLARNARFVLMLRDSGLPLTFCDLPNPPDGAVGRFMIGQMALFAEFEADRISERTKAALKVARSRGKKLGVHGKALARRRRAEADQRALRVSADFFGVYGVDMFAVPRAKLMGMLNSSTIRPPSGKPWGRTTMQRLLSRLVRLVDARD